jgi:hypothetical protein
MRYTIEPTGIHYYFDDEPVDHVPVADARHADDPDGVIPDDDAVATVQRIAAQNRIDLERCE